MDNERYARIRGLFIAVLAISIATLVAAAVVGANTNVWVRGSIVTAVAAILLALAKRARAGSRGAYLRMRVITMVAPIAVLVIVALPHDGFPAWMKGEQVVVGVLLALVAIMLNRLAVRRAYGRPTA